jgi:ABC-type transport system involved in multi-copper enzyme maturation permease subunit
VIAQTRAELLKLRTTRTMIGLVLGVFGGAVLYLLLTGLLIEPKGLAGKQAQRAFFTVEGFVELFSALSGVLLVTGEYRFGTIRPTFLFSPRRSKVIAAKLVASLIAGLTLGVVGIGLAFSIGYLELRGRGIPLALDGVEITQLVVGALAGAALWGALGVAFGAIVRTQVGAIIGVLTWGFLVENVVFAFVPSVGRFGPGAATSAITGLATEHLLAPAAGAVVLVAWAGSLALAAVLLTARRDVT